MANTPKTKFSPVTYEFIEKIRVWRNSPRIRENMLDDVQIGASQQKIWFENLDKRKDRQYKVFFQNEKPIGMLYFSNISNDSCEWGCFIGEEAVWPGTGVLLAVAALDYAFNVLKVSEIHAEVFDYNKSPIALHKTFGYSEIEEKEVTKKSGRKAKLRCFSYSRENWVRNRMAVLGKLPKQIRSAADLIKFN